MCGDCTYKNSSSHEFGKPDPRHGSPLMYDFLGHCFAKGESVHRMAGGWDAHRLIVAGPGVIFRSIPIGVGC